MRGRIVRIGVRAPLELFELHGKPELRQRGSGGSGATDCAEHEHASEPYGESIHGFVSGEPSIVSRRFASSVWST